MNKARNHSLQSDVENEPPFTDRAGASKKYFHAFIKPLSDKFVLLLVAFGVGAIAIVEGVALTMLIPLHERTPYFIEQEMLAGKPTGRVERSDRVVTKFAATEANKRHFLKQWLLMVMPIDQKLTLKFSLPKATSWTRGNATGQLQDWTSKEKLADRMERDPTLTREIDSMTISFISEAVAIAHVTMIERSHGVAKTTPIRKVITLEHALLPLENEEQEYDNPIGLTLTGFTVADDMEKQ